jgi:hypothetical protein
MIVSGSAFIPLWSPHLFVPLHHHFKIIRIMTANERFEKAWGSFLVYLNRNPKAQLTPFLKERHINHRTMMNWMCEKGYSVLRAKKEIRQAQEAARREKAEASTSSTGMMFVPMEPPTIDLPMEDLLYGINITFPNGTLVSVKKGCAKSVMALMKLYEKEDAVCLD